MKSRHAKPEYTTKAFEQDMRYGGTFWSDIVKEGNDVWEVYRYGAPGPPPI